MTTYTKPCPIDIKCMVCMAGKGLHCSTKGGREMPGTHKVRAETFTGHWQRIFDSTQVEPIAVTSNEVYIARERDYSPSVKVKEARMGGRYWRYRAVSFLPSGVRRFAELLVADYLLDPAFDDVQGDVIARLAEEVTSAKTV